MTPAEVVACVERMQRNVENVLLFLPTWRNEPTDDDEVAMYAAIAFHEAGKLLDFCAPKTCGTCAHVLVRPGHGDFGDWLRCGCEYAPAYLADVTYTECCRSWRRKEVPSDCA